VSPAVFPRERPLDERLLHVDPRRARLTDARVGDLPEILAPGDLLVVNDGATLPASLHGVTAGSAPVEARLIGVIGDLSAGRFSALLFGAGDWRTRTEDRPAPPRLPEGSVLRFGEDLSAVVERVSPSSARLVEVAFRESGARLWSALYRRGRPIQYAHLAAPLDFWDVQTPYASRPICAELPSAGRPLVWGLLLDLLRRGVRVASLLHAAGLSSTGDPALDALLPLPERYEIPEETARAVREAKREGRRVIAVGTTVTRALEGAAAMNGGELRGGAGVTDLVLQKGYRPRIVDGLLTGVHDPSESHFRLLEAFAEGALLRRAHAHAERAGYLCHEFGDSSLILS
jgi:S-adenosylmethionine:tRNA ribosyltransferase-isomerase